MARTSPHDRPPRLVARHRDPRPLRHRRGGVSVSVPNRTTPEGRALGREMARLCDAEFAGKPDLRCGTCAFRAGDHLANGSTETLMDALKCTMEGTPFWCHEHDGACAGWAATISKKDPVVMPW